MTREKELLKNTIIISIGKISTSLITFLLLPLYTAYLTTKEYGTVDLLTTLTGLLLPIVTLQIEKAVFRDLITAREDESQKKKIISTSIFAVLGLSVIFTILFILFSSYLKIDYKVYLAINVDIYIFTSLLLQITRGLGDNKKYSIGSIISSISTIIFSVIFLVVFNMKVEGMLIGTFIGQICLAIYLFKYLNLYKYISLKSNSKKIFFKMCKYSVPLIPNAIAWWIFNASDRAIVSYYLDLSHTGILSAALKFSAAYISLYGIFDMSWTESISIHIKDDDITDYFNNLFNKMASIFISGAIMIIIIMPFVFNILINVDYSAGYNLIPISIIASVFNVIVGLVSVVYVALKDSKNIAITSVVSAIINIIVHILLIKYIGLYAAVISTLVSYIILCLYRCINISNRYFKIRLSNKNLFLGILLMIASIIFYINNSYLNLGSLVILMMLIIYLNLDNLSFIINIIKRKVSK